MENNRSLRILTPAKINLYLQVIGKRDDGYHDLASLMCCISLYDEILVEIGDHGTSVACSHPDVPQNETNLAYLRFDPPSTLTHCSFRAPEYCLGHPP